MNILRHRLVVARARLKNWQRGTGPFQTPEFPRVEIVRRDPPPEIGIVTAAELTLLYRHLLNSEPPRPLVTHDQRLAYLRKQVSDRVLGVHLASIRRAWARRAYGEWCRKPEACAGKGYCPLDPTCAD